ncbi:MAG: helix-turn-helix domain-containing protein [Candidatus Aminicenantes bacterium]|nr:helix-turn-helix domain-containing protein [Candidatus Aminicenantes bacterium]MDH5744640.1 helix-turn-helix domain-containing protein [Candidatus Aminicenantes bacterium]
MSISKRRRDKGHKSFVMLSRRMLRFEEWKDLSPAAKLFYIYLKGKYNGINNGGIQLHYSELKGVKGLSSPSTISKASKELERRGWIRRTKQGGLHRYYNEYELTGDHDECL